MEIEVFLRSILLTSQLTSLHYSYDYHYYLEKNFRGNYHWLRDQGFSKGRIFNPESAALLPLLDKAIAVFEGDIRIYDLNTFRGKFCSWQCGIRQTPSVLLQGQLHSGLEASRLILKDILDVKVG